MNESRKDKENSTVKPDNLPLSVIKTDVNLSRLPFFALSRKVPINFKTELLIAETRDNKRLELLWKVTANVEYGYPSPFAKKVHRAVEYLLTKNGFPVSEYLDFSFYQIEDILELPHSGRTYDDIKHAIMSIALAGIESQGTFCYLESGRKKWVHDVFHLYERVIFAGEQFPDGTIADRNRIYFSEWYLKSLNSLYIKPLDFPYWNSLRSDIARRLYEYLSFISFATKCNPFSIEYYRLCEFLPIVSRRYFSDARRQMKFAHEELMNTGFLKKVVWRKSKTDPKKWIIVYHFGMRAKSELQRGFKDNAYRPTILAVETADIEEIEEVIESEEEEQKAKPKRKRKQTQEELPPIAQALCERGITRAVAVEFAESFPEEYLREKIEMHDYRKETGEISQNAAGWLREAIVRDYKLSEQQLKKQAQLKEKRAQQQEQRTLEEKAKQIQEQRLKEALANFPSEEQWVRERVMEHVKVREMTIKAVGGEQFSKEEIERMYLNYKAQIPKTEEEKRGWLVSNYNKYALSAIISELRKEQEESQPKEEKYKENANEQVLFNTVEEVLGEVARQMAEYEAQQKRSENEKKQGENEGCEEL